MFIRAHRMIRVSKIVKAANFIMINTLLCSPLEQYISNAQTQLLSLSLPGGNARAAQDFYLNIPIMQQLYYTTFIGPLDTILQWSGNTPNKVGAQSPPQDCRVIIRTPYKPVPSYQSVVRLLRTKQSYKTFGVLSIKERWGRGVVGVIRGEMGKA